MKAKLSILTINQVNSKKSLKIFNRNKNRANGPSSVLSSIINGFSDVGFKNYNINPLDDYIADSVLVLSGVNNLRRAIQLKKKGTINFLAAGPNIVSFPTDENSLICSEMVDQCIVPCTWVKDMYLKMSPSLAGRVKIWYAGVNTSHWSNSRVRGGKALLYIKDSDQQKTIDDIRDLLDKKNIKYNEMIYGKYNAKEYKKILANSDFGVYVSNSESQGIALAEAWSMDVPTFVWSPGFVIHRGVNIQPVSSAPYISTHTGELWKNTEELEGIISRYQEGQDLYHPRKWILSNMTNEISAKYLLNIIIKSEDLNV